MTASSDVPATGTEPARTYPRPEGCDEEAWAAAITLARPGHTPVGWYLECMDHPMPEVDPALGEWEETHFSAGEDGMQVCAATFEGVVCSQCTEEKQGADQTDEPVWWAIHAVYLRELAR